MQGPAPSGGRLRLCRGLAPEARSVRFGDGGPRRSADRGRGSAPLDDGKPYFTSGAERPRSRNVVQYATCVIATSLKGHRHRRRRYGRQGDRRQDPLHHGEAPRRPRVAGCRQGCAAFTYEYSASSLADRPSVVVVFERKGPARVPDSGEHSSVRPSRSRRARRGHRARAPTCQNARVRSGRPSSQSRTLTGSRPA